MPPLHIAFLGHKYENSRLPFLWHFCNAFDLNMTWGESGLPFINENVSENGVLWTYVSWFFQQFHSNLPNHRGKELRFYYPIKHCALAPRSSDMKPWILASPTTLFSPCKDSLGRKSAVFHNSRISNC